MSGVRPSSIRARKTHTTARSSVTTILLRRGPFENGVRKNKKRLTVGKTCAADLFGKPRARPAYAKNPYVFPNFGFPNRHFYSSDSIKCVRKTNASCTDQSCDRVKEWVSKTERLFVNSSYVLDDDDATTKLFEEGAEIPRGSENN